LDQIYKVVNEVIGRGGGHLGRTYKVVNAVIGKGGGALGLNIQSGQCSEQGISRS